MRRIPAMALAALTLLGGAAACATSDDAADRSTSGGSAGEVPAAGAEGGGTGAGDDGGGSGGEGVAAGAEPVLAGDPGTQAPETAAERIVYTADVRVRVEDPAAAANRAVERIEAAGGTLAAQSEDDGQDLVTLTVRVPVDGFRPALDVLAEEGEVLDRQVTTEEVTDQVVDLEARLANARASTDRLRELYATAQGVDQIVAIEQALTQREGEVEALAGQLQLLEDRADRSTITATFVDEGEPVADEPEEERTGFVGGLRTGWDVIVAGGGVLATLGGFLVPFLPVIAMGVVLLVLLRRRLRRTGPVGPPDTALPDPAP